MGLHIAMNMQSSGIRAYGYDIQTGPRKQAKAKGIPVVQTLQELIAALQKPRIIWLMLPAGDITESMEMCIRDRGYAAFSAWSGKLHY